MQFSKLRALVAAGAVLAGVAMATPSIAQDKPADTLKAPVIAVVDVQKIMQESNASKGVSKSFESLRETYQKEIASLEDKLRKSEEELRKQQTVLAPDVLANKRRDFEKQVGEVQKTVQSRKRALETALNDAMAVVHKNMVEIVADVARERGANLVLARQQFVLVDTHLDVTDVVLERVNKKLPQVALTVPKQ